MVEEAPIDGAFYGRKSGTWKNINIPNMFSELDNGEKDAIKAELGVLNTIQDAPIDGEYYSRKNGTWISSSLSSLAANANES